MTQLPAVVTIPDLPAGTAVTGTELFEAVQTSGGVGNSVKLTLSQMVTGVVGGLPSGGGTGQILLSSGTGLLSQWANISSNVLASTGLAQAGSTTVSLSLASTVGLSILGVGGTGSAVPAPIVGTADQVLIVNHAGNTAQFGAVNLATSAAVTGVLPTVNGGLGTTTGGANTVLAGSTGAPSFTTTPTIGQLTILPAGASLSAGLTVSQTVAGTFTTANTNLNFLSVGSDNANLSTLFGVGLESLYTFGGSSMQGGRTAISGNANLATTSSSSNLNRNYVGVTGLGEAIVNDNGVGTANASAAGAVFGGNFIGVLGSSAATAFLNLSGCEFNTQAVSGATVWAKTLAQFSALPGDKTQGAVVDTMLWFYNQSTGNPGWNNGFLVDNGGGVGAFPISSTGTIFKVGVGTAAAGIDLSSATLNTAFLSKNFTVDGVGNVNATTYQLGGHSFALFDSSTFYIGNRGGTGFAITTDTNPNNSYRANLHNFHSPTAATLYANIASSGGFSVGTSGDAGTGNIQAVGTLASGSSTALVSGGTTSFGLKLSSAANFGIFCGSGAPTISAGTGSLYIRTDGSTATTRLYSNLNGATSWTSFVAMG